MNVAETQPQLILTSMTLSVPSQPNVTVTSIFGWIVFHQRTVALAFNWNLPWASYKNGFGTIGSNFWLGLERLHLLTASSTYRLRVELQQVTTGLCVRACVWVDKSF